MRLLAGDVGGTKTWLALYEASAAGRVVEIRSERYDSRSYVGLAPMLHAFLGDARGTVTRAGIGVAGPVINDTCNATNLPWQLDARALEVAMAIPRVRLLNDFHAVALGIGALSADELVVLQDAPVDPNGPVAVLGAGTGLGEAVVVRDHAGPRVLASEGGHTDFAPRDEIEMDLLRFLLRRHKRVSYERVLSGPGLHALYEFVLEAGLAQTTDAVRAQMLTEDPGAVIGQAALLGEDPACVRAVAMFLSLYGAEAGNLALKVLATGGIYVAGGIAPKLISLIPNSEFVPSFLHKGRMSVLLQGMRLSIVTNPRVGLLGACIAATME